MKCPECERDQINKNGNRGQKQNYISHHPTIPLSHYPTGASHLRDE
ncbi:hypothetical protein [Microcystis sp. BLCC-F210]